MKLRKKLKLLPILVIGLALAACGAKNADVDNSSTTNEDQITLRFSWWGGESRHEATLKAIELYEKENPNVKIEGEYAGWDGYQEKQTTQMSGGTEADIMQVNWNWLTLFSKDGEGFYDINNLKDQIDLSNYSQDQLDLTTLNGKLNAIPIGFTGRTFFWNQSTFDKAGVGIPENIDQLKEAGKTFKEKLGEDYYPLDLDPYSVMLFALYSVEENNGKPFISADNTEVNYTVDELASGLKLYKELVDSHAIYPLVDRMGSGVGNGTAEQTAEWIDGRLAGIYEWDSAVNKYMSSLDEANNNIVLGPYLSITGNNNAAFTKISQCFAISKNTKHPEEAAKFINWLLTDEEAVKTIGFERGIPANKKAIETLSKDEDMKNLTFEANKLAMSSKSNDISPYFEDTELQAIYRKAIENYCYEEITAEEAAEEIINAVNEKLQKEQKEG